MRAQIANGKDLVASLLARLEPSLRFRFSLIALGCGDKNKMAARLRPARKLLARDASHGQDSAIQREALPIAEGKHISTARLRPVQGISNSRGDGPAFAALRRLRLQNWPTPLEKPNWSETPAQGFVGLLAQV